MVDILWRLQPLLDTYSKVEHLPLTLSEVSLISLSISYLTNYLLGRYEVVLVLWKNSVSERRVFRGSKRDRAAY